MKPNISPIPRSRGLTLTEILVVLAVVAVLVIIGLSLGSRAIERTKHTADIMKMRQINSSILARATENNGIAYTKQETGNSVYRQWDDPMSLCQVLKDYISEDAWVGPGAIARHKKYKNSYAWSQAAKISYDSENPGKGYHIDQIDNPGNVVTIWNNFCYTLPSGFNRPESNSVGPKAVTNKAQQFRPWKRKTASNWFYLDGHVETF